MEAQNIRIRLKAFDHRVLDGREAAGFLADIAAVLERPSLALAR